MLTVAGLVPFTTIDFPGLLAAVLFLRGCPLKCPFCHNYALQTDGTETDISPDDIHTFLVERRGRLDGIVLSGGEPLKHNGIIKLAQEIKAMGYQVGLHTSGVYPDRLKAMLPVLDWVGLDIKAPWHKYDLLTGRAHMDGPVRESLNILLKSGIAMETRTTADPRFLTKDDILTIGKTLASQGVQGYVLQHYRTFDGDVNPPDESAIQCFFKDQVLQDTLHALFPRFAVR